jgi:hypothetical protein
MWLLQECDVPYVHDEWVKLLETYGRGSKVTGMTIFGRYLSKMKLKQFKDYRWKDTEFLQELADSKLEQTMKRQGYSAAEITMAQEQKKIIVYQEKIFNALSQVKSAISDEGGVIDVFSNCVKNSGSIVLSQVEWLGDGAGSEYEAPYDSVFHYTNWYESGRLGLVDVGVRLRLQF